MACKVIVLNTQYLHYKLKTKVNLGANTKLRYYCLISFQLLKLSEEALW